MTYIHHFKRTTVKQGRQFMSTQVADLLVNFRADISNLGAGIAQAKREIGSIAEAAQSTGNGILSGFKSGISGVLDFGAKIGQTVIGMQGLAQGAVGLASALLEPNASMEQTTVGFETLLGKGKATQDFLSQLKDFAAATPFEFPELATDAQHMLAFGFTAKEVIPTLTNIGDAMGAMGKSSADIDHIVGIFGQMHAAGKLNAGDMMQLADEGIPAWKMLAEAMGKTVPEVQKLTTSGLIPADTAIKAVSEGMHKMFGGGMAAQANTFNGLLSTLQDNASAALRAFTGPLFDKAKTGLTQLGNLVSSKQFQDFATKTGTAIGTAFTDIGNVIGPVVTGIGAFVGWLQQGSAPAVAVGIALAMIAGGFAAIQIGAFIAAVPALVGGFIAWAVAAWTAAAGTIAATWPLFAIGAAVVAVVAIIVLAVKNWGAISKWISEQWGRMCSWVGEQFSKLGSFLHDTATNIKNGVGDKFDQLGTNVHNKTTEMGVNVLNTWNKLNHSTDSSWQDIANTAGKRIGQMKDSVIASVGQMVSNVVIWLINLKNQAGQKANDIVAAIRNFFTNLPGEAMQWGRNIIQGLINGIGSMLGNLSNMAGQAAQTISNFLPHSPAKEGPLRELNVFGPSLVKGFASGIDNSAPMLRASMAHLVTIGTYPIKPSAGMIASSVAPAMAMQGSTGGQGQTIILEVDGMVLAKVTQKNTDKLVRLKLGSKGRVV